jgi:hypothetical protein
MNGNRALLCHLQIGFVHQRCGLQSVSTPLAAQVVVRQAMELSVKHGNQRVQSFPVAGFPLLQEYRN